MQYDGNSDYHVERRHLTHLKSQLKTAGQTIEDGSSKCHWLIATSVT